MITVHIRRGDFRFACDTPPCRLSLSAFKQTVDKMQTELLQKRGIEHTRVLLASGKRFHHPQRRNVMLTLVPPLDESDSMFYDEVRSYGWTFLNHTSERTAELYGEWHPILIDKVSLSMGIGFVGTDSSTFSILNARRVEDWNNGVTVLLNYYTWGQ